MKLSNYTEWKHCITVDCGIALTPEYIDARIKSLNDANDLHTMKFIDTWGADHLESVKNWFLKARSEFSA